MKIEDYIKHLKQAKQQIIDELPAIAEELAVSTFSLVKDRSINEGIEVKGQKKSYSTKLISTSSFKGKAVKQSAADAYIAANKLGTWGEFRKAQGRQSDVVDLSYTNRMWNNIQLLRTEVTGYGKITAVLGAVEEENQKKLRAHMERYGDFLQPTPEEKTMKEEVANERILSIIRGR